MLIKRLTDYLLCHRQQALLLTFLVTFIPVVGVVGMVYAGFVTLVYGMVEGGIFTLAATLPFVISFLLVKSNPEIPALIMWVAYGFPVLINLLIWGFAVMLVRRVTWSELLQCAALLGVLTISVLHLVYPDITSWCWAHIRMFFLQTQQMALMSKQTVATLDPQHIQVLNLIKDCATGILMVLILLTAMTQLIVSEWWQAVCFNPGQLRRDLHQIRLSTLAGYLFVIAVLLSYLGNMVTSDIMPILYVLFAAAGLSVVHYLVSTWQASNTWLWLLVFYVVVFFTLPISLKILSIIALIDTWADLRQRLKKV